MAEILRNQKEVGLNMAGLPFDREFIFSDHQNVYKKGIEKRQTKLLGKITFLKPFLKEDEKILLVTTGCSPMTFFEQLLMGWIVFYMKQSLFVFTNKRIFHIPTKSNNTYRNSIANIPYANCRTVEMKGRSLVVTYQNGKKEKFYYIPGKEKKKITALMKTIPLENAPDRLTGRVHLCPRCTGDLIAEKYICPNCRLEFKSKSEGKRVSILYPGGGYFYTGHWWLGIGDAFAELILLLLVIVSLVEAIKGAQGGFIAFVFFLVMLILEKATSVYHSNHFIDEYIPAKKDVITAAAAR